MKILWIVNIMLPEIAKSLGLPFSNREGWLSGIFNEMTEASSEYELSVAYPYPSHDLPKDISIKGINCYAFYEDLSSPHIYDVQIEPEMKNIFEKASPDLIHVFGTEFPHAAAALKVWNNPKRALVGMQGVVSEIAKDYMAELPLKVCRSKSLRDILRKDSLKEQQEKFFKRSENEAQALKNTLNITGRTEFDKNAVLKINPDCKYYHMNETMRADFYEGQWKKEEAVPYRIFIGQADYPIKGMHFLLEAAGMLLSDYPDLSIVFAGNSIIRDSDIKSRIKIPAYGIYLKKLIRKNYLQGKVISLGALDAKAMKQTYLQSSVFVCASYIENSPNTLAEATLLGVPAVTSDAGGILSMVSKEEALIFKRGDARALAKAIRQVFEEEESNSPSLNTRIQNERRRALSQYDGTDNYSVLLNIYNQIMNEE